ncbi:hypothetical protein [Candidatus Nitrotoga sp. 1052]|uniref:hypothetical protein n=1 Tax=Candidatus Nitrotoga sp. 1052 TaxID=2886964 RepID=UPI001EF5AF07|nr:hypothetical protein [Candidatus Nitrotoga sp. 1052]CAH1088076.1 conserved hypothetical protein [Candidatus Nitrotoga sp. 1052]
MTNASAPPPPKTAGFHITRGVALRIPVGGLTLTLDDDGEAKMELKGLLLRLDTSVHWLEIATDHLAQAKTAHESMAAAHADGKGTGDLLQSTFKAAMQAIVAGATFFEALYAASRDCMPPGRLAPRASDRSGAKRSALVTEQLKRSFGLKPRKMADLASVLSEVYRFRDEAVHPSSSFGTPAVHPMLGVMVERRFAMYTYPNAQLLVRAALAYCKILPTIGKKDGPKEIQELAQYLLTAGEPHFNLWDKTYGPLLDATAA